MEKWGYSEPLCQIQLAFMRVNPLNAQLNPICHFLASLVAHHILHVSRIRVKLRLLETTDIFKHRKEY